MRHRRRGGRGDSWRHQTHSPCGFGDGSLHGRTVLPDGAVYHSVESRRRAGGIRPHIQRGIQSTRRHRRPGRHSPYRRTACGTCQRCRHRHGLDNARRLQKRPACPRRPHSHARPEHRQRTGVHTHCPCHPSVRARGRFFGRNTGPVDSHDSLFTRHSRRPLAVALRGGVLCNVVDVLLFILRNHLRELSVRHTARQAVCLRVSGLADSVRNRAHRCRCRRLRPFLRAYGSSHHDSRAAAQRQGPQGYF